MLDINIQGVGVVSLDAETISIDSQGKISFQSGPHHLMADSGEPDYTPICEALR
jgi:hypothetical protein